MRHALLLVPILGLLACNASSTAMDPGSAEGGADSGIRGGGVEDTGVGAGDAARPIGTPCVPLIESHSTFDGYSSAEISLTSPGAPGAPTCLVYHFRGLVTCPYGQNASGQAPAGASPCTTTGGQPVVGAVAPQCTDRPASKVVLWSCRCANLEGQTNDGDTYCTCPSSMTCAQAYSSIGASEDDVSGAYCLPPAEVRDGAAICAVSCDPKTAPCQ